MNGTNRMSADRVGEARSTRAGLRAPTRYRHAAHSDQVTPRREGRAVRAGLRVLLALALAGTWSCSELDDNPLPPTGPAAKAHPEGWLAQASAAFHGESIRQAGWDMSGCQGCHGEDYLGGISGSNCATCHPGTPEGCDVCHGGAGLAVPPEDTQGNSATTFAGVGAHQAHLSGAVSTALECTDCHVMPSSYADPIHIDGDGRAEVAMGARAAGPAGLTPVYDYVALTCSDTYCHSGGRLGSNAVPVWNEVSGEACGTCHALPPPPDTGHLAVVTCHVCHSSVVDEDLQIVDPARHINGETDYH